MSLKTYQSYSMHEVLDRIKQELGENAVILHTRTFKRGGLFGIGSRTIYEVTATTSTAAAKERNGASSKAKNKTRTAALASHGASDRVTTSARASTATSDPPTPVVTPPTAVQPSAPAPAPAPTPTPISAEPDPTMVETRPVKVPAPQPTPPVRQATRGETPVARRYVINEVTPGVRPARQEPVTNAPPAVHVEPVARKTSTSPAMGRTQLRGMTESRNVPAPRAVSSPLKPRQVSEPHAMAVKDELDAIRHMVGTVLQRQNGSTQPSMPEALFEQYLKLIENEVAHDVADEVCALVRDELSPDELKNRDLVNQTMLRHLAQYIPVADGSADVDRPNDGRPLTVALVGPTGVGKTTTVAKLAAAFKLRHGLRLGLITTDTYRIAAVDQLRTYANIIGVQLKVALTPTEMASACHAFRDCDVILIDTAGRSPNDEARIVEIREFLESAAPHEVHLVLSSTSSESVLKKTFERFEQVHIDRLIFTKLDEAVNFGVLINVIRHAGKELSYITTGQEVPDDIEVGSPDRLARLVIGEMIDA